MNPENTYWINNFNTQLDPEKELQFKAWMQKLSQERGHDMSQDLIDYDLRGAFLNNVEGDTNTGHFTDKYKKPNHPSFSNESIYHGTPDPFGGKWEGGQWKEQNNQWTFAPSMSMMNKTHNWRDMYHYFRNNEPDVKLINPMGTGF